MADTPLPPLLGQLKELAMDELHRRLHEQGENTSAGGEPSTA